MNKGKFVWFAVVCVMVGATCLIPYHSSACEGRGTYFVSEGRLHLPFVDIVTTKGIEKVIEARLERISESGTEHLFKLIAFETVSPQTPSQVSLCHASYHYDGQVQIPFVDIPEQNLTVSATLKEVSPMTTRKGSLFDATEVQACTPSASESCVPGLSTTSQYALFLEKLSFLPEEARYAPEVKKAFQLTTDEMARLQDNGFVVTDRLAFEDFSNAYAYIYWKDLPVVITTDSILQAIHKTYADLLMRLEAKMLAPQLAYFLNQVRQQLRTDAAANTDPDLASLYTDVDSYLSVPLALLTADVKLADINEQAKDYLEPAQQANGTVMVRLFSGERKVDFSLFKPRGHYIKHARLKRYFRAMSWLAHVDFRLVEYDRNGEPSLNVNHIAAAVLLKQAITSANQRTTWQAFDHLISTFVGQSDNTTLSDLDRFLAEAEIETAEEILQAEPTQLLSLLTNGDYGQQQITGQLLEVAPNNPKSQSRPISFMMLGQRFAIDSYIMSQLVYDQLFVKGKKVFRPLPSPLDVMYALGNERAKNHLQTELAQYGYQDNLNAVRTVVESYEANFWTSSTYNRWLSTLRALNVNTTDAIYPQAMRTAAWADKMLHTQLASWAQLRHNNILYVQQSFTMGIACEYPAGYVEPYPTFYAAVRDYARAGEKALLNLDLTTDNQAEQMLRQLENEGSSIDWLFPEQMPIVRNTALTYFKHLEWVTTMLQTMAEKELRLEPFSPAEETFIKETTIVQRKMVGCGELREKWRGWYPQLFPWEDDSPAMIADIHTNPNTMGTLAPPRVLHVATGPVATMILIADTDEGPTMYTGPSFTYYEVIEEGMPLVRLTDNDWKNRLRESKPRPTSPDWTMNFRVPVSKQPEYLKVPIQSSSSLDSLFFEE